MDLRGPLLLATALLAMPTEATAADKQPGGVDVLIVSDGVNPHNLSAPSLTEPGELETALLDPGVEWGIDFGAVDEVSSQCVDEALALLDAGDVDVVIYFAHRAAQTCDGRSVQALLTTHMERHLRERGGVVVFHHGIYQAAGKTQLLELLGGTASRFEWFPREGQAVINVAPSHPVTTDTVGYDSSTPFEAMELGVSSATYPSFMNIPDERYPELTMLTQPGESRIPLFASDYDGAQLLGYDLHRPDWKGHVILYQPGEYQPHALGEGPNRQILANAISYAATQLEGEIVDTPEPETTGDSGDSAGESEGTETTATTEGGASSGFEETDSATTSHPGAGSSTGMLPTTTGGGRLGPSELRSHEPRAPPPPVPVPTAQPRARGDRPDPVVASCHLGVAPPSGAGLAWLALLLLGVRRRPLQPRPD